MSKNRLSFKAQLSRHSHDIHGGYSASLAPGMIIPQYFHVLNPGDTVYYSSRMFARLKDVVTAFLGEIDIHIDSFFVPLQMMYTPFGQVFAQTDDLISSFFDPANFNSNSSFPLLNVKGSLEVNKNSDPSLVGFEPYGKTHFRLLDALDLNSLGVCSANLQQAEQYQSATVIDDQITYNPNISPWIVCAYNAIYQKYYRNDELERLDVENYNFDQYYNTASFIHSPCFEVRYVQRPKDYFTSVRVSPIASAVNSFFSTSSVDGGTLDNVLYNVDSFLDSSRNVYKIGTTQNTWPPSMNGSAFDTTSSSAYSSVGGGTPNTNVLLSTAANIRALFAVDKFARIYGRADKTYDDQILAHFGIKIPHDVKHDITHLKHDRAVLQADPIYATASSSVSGVATSLVGQVGGQGSVTFSTEQDKFTAPVHGVFMIVAYATVKPRYLFTFSKLHLLTDRLRFPIPEFDKLGAQPMYAFEANPQYFQHSNVVGTRIGWQNRYSEFKEKYNRASMNFYAGQYGHGSVNVNSYGPWVVSQLPFDASVDSSILPQITGSGSTTQAISSFVPAIGLFQNPSALNTVMVANFNPAWNNQYFEQPHLICRTDPIITEYTCDCKLVSWMSETGEPDL